MKAETLVRSLRATPAEWSAIAAAAERAAVSVNAWCISVLWNAATEGPEGEAGHLAAAARTKPHNRPVRRAGKVLAAKAALQEAEAGAAHLAQPPAHTIQVGPKRPVAGALLKRRPRFG